ncbi:hypothetical protein PMAYCL1PPCAC_01407, partial [Pristionchus mayeri]
SATNLIYKYNDPYFNITGGDEVNHCASFSNCDFCVTDERCGFCEYVAEDGTKTGFCLPFDGSNDTAAFSGTGPCNFISPNPDYEWEDGSCVTPLTILPIIIMFIYLCFFSIGFAPIPWTLNAEFYPLWARSTCASIATAFNWIFNLLVSLTFLSLSQAVTKYGAFFIYAGFTVIALIVIWFYVPETMGLNIEEIEFLFMSEEERKKHTHKVEDPVDVKNHDVDGFVIYDKIDRSPSKRSNTVRDVDF